MTENIAKAKSSQETLRTLQETAKRTAAELQSMTLQKIDLEAKLLEFQNVVPASRLQIALARNEQLHADLMAAKMHLERLLGEKDAGEKEIKRLEKLAEEYLQYAEDLTALRAQYAALSEELRREKRARTEELERLGISPALFQSRDARGTVQRTDRQRAPTQSTLDFLASLDANAQRNYEEREAQELVDLRSRYLERSSYRLDDIYGFGAALDGLRAEPSYGADRLGAMASVHRLEAFK